MWMRYWRGCFVVLRSVFFFPRSLSRFRRTFFIQCQCVQLMSIKAVIPLQLLCENIYICSYLLNSASCFLVPWIFRMRSGIRIDTSRRKIGNKLEGQNQSSVFKYWSCSVLFSANKGPPFSRHKKTTLLFILIRRAMSLSRTTWVNKSRWLVLNQL